MKDDKYTTFAQVCQECLTDETVFATFKQNWNFTYMLEQHWETTDYIGIRFCETLNERYGDLLKDLPWTRYRENDQLGGPRVHLYDQLNITLPDMHFSHTTLRYIYFSLELIAFLNWDQPPSEFSIIEIGGGYGGQCKILKDTFRHFYPTLVLHYTIVDLAPVSRLQQKYLHRLDVHGVTFHTPETYPKDIAYDCCFSSYAIGEIDLDIQFEYIEHILLHCAQLYLLWNQTDVNPYLEFKRVLEVKPEYPEFTVGNKIVTSLEKKWVSIEIFL